MYRAHRLPAGLDVPATLARHSISIERNGRARALEATRNVSAAMIVRLSVDAVLVVVVICLIGQVLIGLIGQSPGGS